MAAEQVATPAAAAAPSAPPPGPPISAIPSQLQAPPRSPRSPASQLSPGSPLKPSSPSTTNKPYRSDWVNYTVSPGPAAYNPAMQTVRPAAERAVFGTSMRENEEKRFISQLHNTPGQASPGPGAYRVANIKLMKNETSAPFGTAPQRPSISREALDKPGAIYDLPSVLSSRSCTFGSRSGPSSPAAGAARAGSPLRAASHTSTPGPIDYALVPAEKLSIHSSPPKCAFGRATREQAVRSSLSAAQLAADPTVGTSFTTPGAQYDVPGALEGSAPAYKFPRGPAHFDAEKGGNSKGPYISRLHSDAMKCIDSPGPGTYDSQSCLSPAGGTKYAPPSPERPTASPSKAARDPVPGPGAHNPHFGAQSVISTPAAFSMGANIRTDFATMGGGGDSPGPAAYGLPSPDRASTKSKAPSFSMGATSGSGRSSFVPKKDTPGPNAYGRPEDPRDKSPTKPGYSFGLRERSRSGSAAGVRYHGPLASAEGMGLESPGPGVYNVAGQGTVARAASPGTRFGTASRDAASKTFFSRVHAASDTYGVASPGPGVYNVAETDLAAATSRYSKPAGAKFGTSGRFNEKVTTF